MAGQAPECLLSVAPSPLVCMFVTYVVICYCMYGSHMTVDQLPCVR